MKNAIKCFILGIVVSFYFFPIELTFLPAGLNTKMILAVLGLSRFAVDCILKRSAQVPKDIIGAFMFAAIFSMSCLYSITDNNTSDFSYAGYTLSFFVWVFGAYAVSWLLRRKYGKTSLQLLARYLAWVGVAQCVSCLLIDNVPAFSSFVDSFMDFGQEYIREELNRMYGIGSALDPAGVRFSIILILLAYYICNHCIPLSDQKKTAIAVFAFLFISFVGNMISRTTTVGMLAGIIYVVLFISRFSGSKWLLGRKVRATLVIAAVLAIAVSIVAYLYNNTEQYDNIRFAFEGFFNWMETGEWRTDSTDKLNREMWIWPSDTKSWLIGTGLFDGFIYGTDVGYCRFILYCGLIGFGFFCLFFVYNASVFSKKYQGVTFLSLVLLGLSFVIWIKVATDIFLIYALFLTADPVVAEEGDEEEVIFIDRTHTAADEDTSIG